MKQDDYRNIIVLVIMISVACSLMAIYARIARVEVNASQQLLRYYVYQEYPTDSGQMMFDQRPLVLMEPI